MHYNVCKDIISYDNSFCETIGIFYGERMEIDYQIRKPGRDLGDKITSNPFSHACGTLGNSSACTSSSSIGSIRSTL